jgi:hypothetical protein
MVFNRIRKSKIQRDELFADFMFLLIAYVISVIMLFIFDIHWNFYPGGHLFPPEQFIFENRSIYFWGAGIGSLVGLFVIKFFLLALKGEEKVWEEERGYKLEKKRELNEPLKQPKKPKKAK